VQQACADARAARGAAQAASLVGGLVGPAVGGLLADVSGLRAPFTLTGVAAAAAAVYGLLRLPETRALGAAARSREADARGAEEAGGSGAVRAPAAARGSSRARPRIVACIALGAACARVPPEGGSGAAGTWAVDRRARGPGGRML